MVGLDFLEEVEVFRGLEDERLRALQTCCEEVEFQRGEQIFGIRKDAEYLWAVEKGEVQLAGGSQPGAGPNGYPLIGDETARVNGALTCSTSPCPGRLRGPTLDGRPPA